MLREIWFVEKFGSFGETELHAILLSRADYEAWLRNPLKEDHRITKKNVKPDGTFESVRVKDFERHAKEMCESLGLPYDTNEELAG